MRVENEGRTTAHGVSLSATEITFCAPGAGKKTLAEEVLEFKLALSQPERTDFDLPPGAHRFVDVFSAANFGTAITFTFAFAQIPARLPLLGFGTGSYSVAVIATAENAAPKKRHISWRWDGTLAGLDIPESSYPSRKRTMNDHAISIIGVILILTVVVQVIVVKCWT